MFSFSFSFFQKVLLSLLLLFFFFCEEGYPYRYVFRDAPRWGGPTVFVTDVEASTRLVSWFRSLAQRFSGDASCSVGFWFFFEHEDETTAIALHRIVSQRIATLWRQEKDLE